MLDFIYVYQSDWGSKSIYLSFQLCVIDFIFVLDANKIL